MRRESGFTLTNILTSLVVLFALITAFNWWQAKSERDAAEALVQSKAKSIEQRFKALLGSELAWRNTLFNRENTGMACLREHKDCEARGGPFVLRDDRNMNVYDSTAPVNGLSFEGGPCVGFSEQGSDTCPFRLDLTWTPQCPAGECIDPSRVILRGKLRFRGAPGTVYAKIRMREIEFAESRQPLPGEPKTCHDLMLAGRTSDGLYNLKPAADQPAFPVYCDQTRDGGGWALIIAAGVSGYGPFQESNALTPSSVGRLPTARVKALLEASGYGESNNIRLELPEVDEGVMLSASSGGFVDPGELAATTNAGTCKGLTVNPVNPVSHNAAAHFSIRFTGAGEAGVLDQSNATEGFYGFYACFGTAPSGQHCGMGCGRKWTGRVLRQKGMLWIR